EEKLGSSMVQVSSVPAGKTTSLDAALPGKARSAAPRSKHKTLAFILQFLFWSCADSANSGRRSWRRPRDSPVRRRLAARAAAAIGDSLLTLAGKHGRSRNFALCKNRAQPSDAIFFQNGCTSSGPEVS